MEDWGEEIFAEGVGVKGKNEPVGRGRGRKNTFISSAPTHQPSPVKYLITIQDGGIESLIYLAFRSKITAALQAQHSIAIFVVLYICLNSASCGAVVAYFTNILGFKDDGIIAK